MRSFKLLKSELAEASLGIIDENIPFVVETDASDFALSATLNQNNRPIDFFSRILHKPKLNHSSVEKEASAFIEANRKWSHLLTGRRFKLLQTSVLLRSCTIVKITENSRMPKSKDGE